MRYFYVLLLFLLPVVIFAQLTVVSTSPANNATNIPLNTTMSVTFSLPVDSTSMQSQNNFFTNVDSVVSTAVSGDKKTYTATIILKPNTMYFIAFLGVRSTTGQVLSAPYVSYFTTGSSFTGYNVSGIVTSSISGVSVQNTFVGLSSTSLTNGNNDGPTLVSWANVNGDGTFQIPYVANGKYWLVAAKDVNGDGNLDPSNGTDAVAFGDSIIVNGSSISGLTLTLQQMKRKTSTEAWTIGDSLARSLPSDRVLKNIRAGNVDTAGRADSWDFTYTHNGNTAATEVSVSSMNSKINTVTDAGYLYGLVHTNALANPVTAAASPLVMAYVEGEGGKAFRTQSVPYNYDFQIEMVLGDMSYSNFGQMFPTPGVQYWGVSYRFGIQGNNNFTTYLEKKFLCNFTTGVVEKATSVQSLQQQVPAVTRLYQNYPNPFNPSTTITYDLARSSFVTLRVYDMLGREVAVLVRDEQEAGAHIVRFDGAQSANGVYFYALELPGYREVHHMVLMK